MRLKASTSRVFLNVMILIFTMGLDQLTKYVAREYLSSAVPLSYLNDSLVLIHSQNSGAFLSLGAVLNEMWRFWIFTILVSLFLIAATVYLFRAKKLDRWSSYALAFVIAGG